MSFLCGSRTAPEAKQEARDTELEFWLECRVCTGTKPALVSMVAGFKKHM